MHALRTQLPAMLTMTVACWPLLGCQLVGAPDASALPAISHESADRRFELHEFALRYDTAESYPRTSEDQPPDGSAPRDANVHSAAVAANSNLISRRLLVVRYPHPNGRLDVARVEIVIAEPAHPTEEAPRTLHDKFAALLSELTPGVSWAPGIQQAKAIEINLTELRQLIGESESWTSADVQRAGGASDSSGVTRDSAATLAIELNGDGKTAHGIRPRRLEQLADRVMCSGSLISVRTPARDLFSDRNAVQLATHFGSTHNPDLTPLPPIE